MTISVSMIVRNESSCIAKALNSVSDADEIIVCDTGSTDDTVEIARNYGAKVTLLRSFNVTYSPLQTTPISIKKVLFNSFSVTVPELAVIEAQRAPFGLITHKKK